MKQRRWMKSVIETAKSKNLAAVALPWQRGTARAVMAARRTTPASKASRTA